MNLYKSIIIAIFGFLASLATAQQDAFQKANSAYKQAKYADALRQYEQIYEQYGVSAALFYNMGNAAYKSNEVGKSILYYEKVLQLEPNHEKAEKNLELAQSKVIDNVIQTPPFFFKQWIDILVKAADIDTWYWISIGLFIFTLSAFLYFVFGYSFVFRKICFYLSFIFISFSAMSLVFAITRYDQIHARNDAIIMTPRVSIKSSPDKSGTNLFQLHEGTKVSIKNKLDNWLEIKVGNGKIGWIEATNLEKI